MFSGLEKAGAIIGIGSRVYGVLCVVKHNYSVLLQQLAGRQEPELYPIRPPQTEAAIYKRVRHVSRLIPRSVSGGLRCGAP